MIYFNTEINEDQQPEITIKYEGNSTIEISEVVQ